MTKPNYYNVISGGAQPLKSLQHELVSLIAEQAGRVPLSLVVSAALIALLTMAYVPMVYPVTWLAAVLATTAIHSYVLMHLPLWIKWSDDRKLTVAAWSFGLHGSVLASLLWLFPLVPVTIGAVITIYNVGLCAATVPATAGFHRIYAPYACVTLGPIALVWATSRNIPVSPYERAVFVGLTLAYMVTMLGHAKGTFAVFAESYNIRLQRLELNEKLKLAVDKAESANRAKTQFLASASHDLRQPIHALSLFTGSLLLRTLDSRTTVIARQIDRAVTALAAQLDALLDISKLDAGMIEKKTVVIYLHSLLSDLINEFSLQAQSKGLLLALHCDEDVHVHSDPQLLLRILRNLISNAVKYTEVGSVTVLVQATGSICRVVVQDTGPGIPGSEHQKIFEEFYQLNNPERDRSKGLGLGLAIVRRLAELLDIPVQMESNPGQGSRFSIEMPLADQAQPQVQTLHVSPKRTSTGIQVLVVDDEETIRLGMKTLLEEMGFGVRAESSTDAAVASTRYFRPSVVLADFRLRGDDDGLRTIVALRSILPDLPALLISGDTAPQRLREAHQAGVTLLHKPVPPGELKKAILRALEL